MERCHLKGETGDRLHAVLCAAGYNIKWLLRMIAKKGVTFLRRLLLRLCTVVGVQRSWRPVLRTWPTGTPRWAQSRTVGV